MDNKHLTAGEVCEIRRRCWEERVTFKQLAGEYGITPHSVMCCARGRTWAKLVCDYPPYLGNPHERIIRKEDEVEMMEMRVDGETYAEIGERFDMLPTFVRGALMRPTQKAADLFFRRNGYRFVDDRTLAMGRHVKVETIIKILELKREGKTSHAAIARQLGLGLTIVSDVIHNKPKAQNQRLTLAENYMENKYGLKWRTW